MQRPLRALALCALLAACSAQTDTPVRVAVITPDAVAAGIAALRPELVESHVRHLASDAMNGRGTGTADKDRAAEWIAARLQDAGARPFVEGSYFQDVELVGFRKDPLNSSLTLRGPDGPIAHTDEVDFTWWSASLQEEVSIEGAPLVFVGHGITAPELQWDDFEGHDLGGKIAVFLNDDPLVTEDGRELFGGPARTYYGRWTYKFEQARDRGALGAIVIHTDASAGYGWQVIGHKGAEEQFDLDAPGAGYGLALLAWMGEELAGRLAATVGADLDAWFASAARRDFAPVELPVTLDARARVTLERTTARNVLGLVEGSDPQLRDEIVVVTAHYDHLGVKSDAEEGEDAIYNGAWDNAAGTAAMLALAQGLEAAEIRPRRSVLFFAVAAHEKGLLGSRWFVAHSPVPIERYVANVNVDMPQIFGPTRDVVAIGADHSELGAILGEVVSRFRLDDGSTLRVADDPTPGAGRFYRSDQLHFARIGVPGLYVGPGTDYLGAPSADPVAYRSTHYHQVSDEVREEWDFAALSRDAGVVLLFVLELTHRSARPAWSATSEFAPRPGA